MAHIGINHLLIVSLYATVQATILFAGAEREYCVSKQKPLYSSHALLSPHLAIALSTSSLLAALLLRTAR
jgi:hypothetical protein